MSIYATYWNIALPVHVRCDPSEKDGDALLPGQNYGEPGIPFKERWIEVYAQAVPAHIGHPSEYPDGDPYADFLPPVTEHDEGTPRAVFIIDKDHYQKEGQRYIAPLLMLTGEEYESVSFGDLLHRIQIALDERLGIRV
jgi:hypothetical protein